MSATKQAAEEKVTGTVRALNFAPKGEVDGFLIDADGETVQVNVPREWAETVETLVGRLVELTAGPEPKVDDHPKGAHRARKLVGFADEARVVKAEPPEKKPHPEQKDTGPVEVTGTVARLNYAKHGESNGVVLGGGEFLHLKPDGMKKTGLSVGQEVRATGKATTRPDGGVAVEVESVNGVEIGHKKPR